MPPVRAYLFRDPQVNHGGDAVVCVIDRQIADERLGVDRLKTLFGGCAVYTTPGGQDFIGVWGARNASRYRRFLRERGATIVIMRGRPQYARLRYTSTHPGRRPRVRTLGPL